MSKEDKALKEFKQKIKDVLQPDHDDDYLRKWLKARNSDPSRAEQMYRESMEFREKMKVDTILEDYTPPEVIQKYLTGGFCGYDKEGSPIRVELFGHLDMKGLMYSCKKTDMEKTKLQQCESTVRMFEEQTKKMGKPVDGLTVIFDMDNVGSKMLWRPGLSMYLHLVKVLEDNYPEMMKRMYVVNAPRIFPLLWKICRPLISDDMKDKIHVLGGDYKSVLLKHIDAEQLPSFLGGKLTDEDGSPRCPTKICPGGDVPESYYLSDLINTENMEFAVVPKGDKLTVDVQVEQAGSLLRWEFKTDDYDISFGVRFTSLDGKSKDVIPLQRVNCHMVPEDGTVNCEEKGMYHLIFDNCKSWVRGKSIRYSYSVEYIPTNDDIRDECNFVNM